jgi:cell division protein FtsB
MGIKWLSNHWFLLAFVFASGGAAAWQEVQRQSVEELVREQQVLQAEQRKGREVVIRLETTQEAIRDDVTDLKGDVKELLKLQRQLLMEERR